MSYASVDQLQKVLAAKVFHYAKDSKKAAGRALGTFVEIITFYALKSWGLERYLAIERPLPEFGNHDIAHNVEYTMHPSKHLATLSFRRESLPLTARKIAKIPQIEVLGIAKASVKTHSLLRNDLVLRNACTVCDQEEVFVNAYLECLGKTEGRYSIVALQQRPFAVVECKRVGVEEGMRKGPQTIEKAKQGAYVARMVSALQKIRWADGSVGGVIQKRDGSFYHGNWFTSENHNKELKVLAQSYDWLLFLTDTAIAQFIEEILLKPSKKMSAPKKAFLASYGGKKGVNQFTKVQVALEADRALQSYFHTNAKAIEQWFNVIAPPKKRLSVLRDELDTLNAKNWQEIRA